MVKRILAMALTIGLGAWVVSSCSGSKKVTTAATGTVAAFIGDVPFCGVLSYRSTITGLTLTPVGGGSPVSVFVISPSSTPLVKVNFGELRDFSTPLVLGTVPVGTYDKATITFSSPEIVIFDPSRSYPVNIASPTLPTTPPTFTIEPALTVTSGKVSGLNIDFNMRQSIALDQQGSLTGSATPVMSFTPVSAAATNGFGEMDDVKGFVTSVTTSSTGTGFIGGFGFQMLSGTAPLFSVNLTSTTQICGPTTASNQTCTPIALNQLLTGSFIEMDGFTDSNGNLVANTLEVEDRETPELSQLALIGNVISVTRDVNGNVTQFSFYVSEEEPDDEFAIALDSIVVVNLSPSTIYQFSSRATNFASLPFDDTALAPGQELVVHGVFTVPPATTPAPAVPLPTTVAADKVYVKLQSHQGNFSSLVAAQSDDKTGAFWMASCGTLFQGAPILVLTDGQTAFVNLTGLSALTPQPTLLVKGLVFFERQGGTVNGVTVPPGTLVLVAKQVHQLQ
jgi:hypothetical protein